MLEEIQKELIKLSTKNIIEYNQKLIPNCLPIYGVSIPLLRKLAKKIVSNDYKCFLNECDSSSFEIQLLEAYVIAGAKMSLKERVSYLYEFIPKIKDWAVCDGLVSSLKCAKVYQEEMLEVVERFKDSKKEFEIRFVAVFLMSYYLNEKYVEKSIHIVQELFLNDYYAKMGVAWFIATLMVNYPNYAKNLLKDPNIDTWTKNKSIAKIRESYRISKEMKEEVLFYKK